MGAMKRFIGSEARLSASVVVICRAIARLHGVLIDVGEGRRRRRR